jgi:hypothetical protein
VYAAYWAENERLAYIEQAISILTTAKHTE